jgi:DNA polymerase-3 subunit delta'
MRVALPLIGHKDAEQTFEAAAASGRMHHAWMIEGPSGIGKAQFAMRCAAWLLGARGPADAPFDAPTDDPVMSRSVPSMSFSPTARRWEAGGSALWIHWMS